MGAMDLGSFYTAMKQKGLSDAEINAQLSGMNLSGRETTQYDTQIPEGYIPASGTGLIRNNSTGNLSSVDSRGSGGTLSDLLTKYGASASNPIDFMGKKGYMTANGNIVGMNPDGSAWKATTGVDRAAQQAAEDRALKMAQANAAIEHTKAQTAQLQNPKPQWEIMTDASGTYRVDKSSGKIEPVTMNGQPFGKQSSQQQQDANAVLSIAEEAKQVLEKGDAHGSTIGNAIGGIANIFGISTDANKADAQLKVLGGALVSKMPKMSGPQSDKDVLLYREMAGQVGDSTIPIDTRLAALSEVKKLNEKYATPQAQQSPSAMPMIGTVKNGYAYVGGDPSQPSSWKKVGQ